MADPLTFTSQDPAQFQTANAGLNYAYTTAKTRFEKQQGDLYSQYGLNSDSSINPNGNGLVQQMNMQQGLDLDAGRGANVARGIGANSGMLGRRQALMRWQNDAQKTGMFRDFNAQLYGLKGQLDDNQFNFDQGTATLGQQFAAYQGQRELAQNAKAPTIPWWQTQ